MLRNRYKALHQKAVICMPVKHPFRDQTLECKFNALFAMRNHFIFLQRVYTPHVTLGVKLDLRDTMDE